VSTFLPASISVVTLSRKTRRFEVQEYPFRKPCWVFRIKSYLSRWWTISSWKCFYDFTYIWLVLRLTGRYLSTLCLLPFLNRGETLAVLQSPGTHRDLRKIIGLVTGTAISSHNAFNIRGDMLSAPAALSSFNFWSLLLIYCRQTLRCLPAWHHTSCPELACQFQVLLWTQMRRNRSTFQL